jgi:opacity protein-like surface antigen
MVHVTGLKNHEAYTDTSGGKKFARLDKTGKSSVGLGLNVETLYRTGSSFCPTFNVGFFVPFDEDLTPFLVFGPGINIGSKNVSLGITGGAALGKINAISGQFKDRDLTGLDLTNEQLTQKVWKWGWQVGIGLRFNIATSKQ